MDETVITRQPQPTLLRRARLLTAVALVWLGLHMLVTPLLRPAGSSPPPVLLSDWATVPGALCLLIVLIAGGYGGAWLVGRGGPLERLAVSGLALALWATTGGTIDDWLRVSHPEAGPPSPIPYLRLLPDYVLLAFAMGVLAWGFPRRSYRRAPGSGVAPGAASTAQNQPSPVKPASGSAAEPPRLDGKVLLLVLVFMAVAILFLMGPRLAATYRGQVYFALLAGGWLAVHALFWFGLASPAVVLRTASGCWLVPILLGLIGISAASFRPALALAAPYNELDTIPAWALVRPLPVEMVGVGVAALALTLRSLARKEGP